MNPNMLGAVNADEKLNFVPVKLTMMFGTTPLGIGTAFFYQYLNSTHLVTNWHNVTGRHPETKKCLHSKAGIPDRVVVTFSCHKSLDNRQALGWESKVISLYEDSEMQMPSWYEHPLLRERVDVVTIPLSGLEATAVLPANEPSLDLSPLRLRPGMDVFVLGFPKGMSGGGHLPIWKRASVATDPGVNLDGLPKLLVDTATREGMSGSPVFAQESGFWIPEGKQAIQDGVFGIGRRFLGIYSGRVGEDPFETQLGIVWKPEAIEDVIKNSLIKRVQELSTQK